MTLEFLGFGTFVLVKMGIYLSPWYVFREREYCIGLLCMN